MFASPNNAAAWQAGSVEAGEEEKVQKGDNGGLAVSVGTVAGTFGEHLCKVCSPLC